MKKVSEVPIRTTSERLVYENKFARVFDNDVRFPGEVRGTYLKLQWRAPYSVAVLPVLEDGRYFLVRPFRYASNSWSLEVPKGFGLQGLEPAEIAARELAEETGLTSPSLSCVASIAVDPGIIGHKCHLFFAVGCRATGAPTPELSEVFGDPIIVSGDEALMLVREGTIVDALTISAILLKFCLGFNEPSY
ncbi:MAG TPA: NUDIX hydrolase [Rhizomicrobium sp.]|nr:NUDIX hydrolase [Rhizomicrobium sp.]